MKKILITGASGFIGKNLKIYLEGRGRYDIYAPSHHEMDLLDSDMVMQYLQQHSFDIILHSAVQGTLGMPEYQPVQLKNNLRMYYNLKRCTDLYGKMYYYGSGAEYGKSAYKPLMPENYFGAIVPEDDYGLSKYIMASDIPEDGNIYDLRLFGVFGRFENYNYRFISNTICKALVQMPIRIHRNVFFDYLYITDLCRITEWFLDHNAQRHQYNVCTSKTMDIGSIAQMVVEMTGSSSEIIVEQEGLGTEYSGDNSRLLSELGDYAFTPMEEAVRELIGFYKATDYELKGDY